MFRLYMDMNIWMVWLSTSWGYKRLTGYDICNDQDEAERPQHKLWLSQRVRLRKVSLAYDSFDQSHEDHTIAAVFSKVIAMDIIGAFINSYIWEDVDCWLWQKNWQLCPLKRGTCYEGWMQLVLAFPGKLRNIRQQCYVTQVPAMLPQKWLRDKGNILVKSSFRSDMLHAWDGGLTK